MTAHRIRAKLFAAVLTAVFLVGLFFPLQVYAQTQTEEELTEYYTFSYVWSYDGETWALNLSIPQALYEDYRSISFSTRSSAGYNYLITSVDTYVQSVADRIHAAAQNMGYEQYDEVSFILAFVNSLSNTVQSTSVLPDDYPNFPVETLVEEGGDCEDNSILLAALLTALGYNIVIIDIDGHIGVGVSGDTPPGKAFYWFYYDKEHYSDKEFYYCETVGGVWKLGQCPEEYQYHDAMLSQVLVGKQYISPVNPPEFFHTAFEWAFNDKTWCWSIDISAALYTEYVSVPLSRRIEDSMAGYGFLTTTNDVYMQEIARYLNETGTAEGYNAYDRVSLVLAFVQSLPYTYDFVSAAHDDYPRFPVETIVDNGGDCEDTSILFATIVSILGYGVVYLHPPDHLAVGVLGGEGVYGTYWNYNDGHYFYCETTGEGWTIGELPSEYSKATVFPIYTGQQYIPKVQVTIPEFPLPTTAIALVAATTTLLAVVAVKKVNKKETG